HDLSKTHEDPEKPTGLSVPPPPLAGQRRHTNPSWGFMRSPMEKPRGFAWVTFNTLFALWQKEIETYKSQKLKEGLSPKSINNQLTTLHKLLDVAVDWGILEHVPRVKWLKGPKVEFDFLTFDEADRLLAAAEPRWFPMIALALKTGLRMGELIALEWSAVDLF